jgi:endoglucanase Acf2
VFVIFAVAVSSVACSGDNTAGRMSVHGGATEGYAASTPVAPRPEGKGSIAATLPTGSRPSRRPAQAGKDIAGRALPTNQWWTSALTGPLTQPMWAFPLALKVADTGIEVSSADPVASPNAVVTPFLPAITAGGPVRSVEVTGYGAFHVALRVTLGGLESSDVAGRGSKGVVEVTLVQGSPLLYLRFLDVAPTLARHGGTTEIAGGRVRLDIGGQRWDVLAPPDASWRSNGDRLYAEGARDGRIAVARVPEQVDETEWDAATADAASDPVTGTTAHMSYDPGTVTQTLSTVRASGRPGVWALLPHQQEGLSADAAVQPLAGGYPNVRGELSLVRATDVRVRVALPGLLTTVPTLILPEAARTAVVADLDRDLADPAPGGGSYFGLKELARLATIAEVAKAVSAGSRRQAALDRLRPLLEDWLTYTGESDGHYFGYDAIWGGLIAVPAEFGSNDYNDHHFQYGYLVRAAAVLADAEPDFLAAYAPMVEVIVREYSGTLSSRGADGFPPFRVFNAYLGNSAAAGFAAFADGNNQESSSEAVAGWEAVVRWGVVRGDATLTGYGLTHYAMEAANARRYWLGEGANRPAGYVHSGVGIVWDGKLDYATWFDAKPESIVGIQLLPLTFGSLYRSDPAAAAGRSNELTGITHALPRVWGDLFAADLALADPAVALARLTPRLPREESTSRAMVRYFVEALAALGPPQPAITVDGPYGLAFGSLATPTLVAVNPTPTARTVTFRRADTVIAQLHLYPGDSKTLNPGN